jgi:cytochrome c oxidase subunit 2
MITQFAFTPVVTTEEMRQNDKIVEKVAKINAIRTEKSKALTAAGEEPLDTYVFDYILLCNKICGVSHYNMQMKIVVESEEDYKAWLAEQPTLAEQLSK